MFDDVFLAQPPSIPLPNLIPPLPGIYHWALPLRGGLAIVPLVSINPDIIVPFPRYLFSLSHIEHLQLLCGQLSTAPPDHWLRGVRASASHSSSKLLNSTEAAYPRQQRVLLGTRRLAATAARLPTAGYQATRGSFSLWLLVVLVHEQAKLRIMIR